MSDRVYIVADKHDGETVYLVRAATPAAAERHVLKKHFEAKVATQDECIENTARGIKVETAGAE